MVVCFEGIDGAGKSTQAQLLASHLRQAGYKVLVVSHPGFSEFGKRIRELLLGEPQPMMDLTARLLFYADHLEAVAELQRQAFEGVVIFDRHPFYSNCAYGAAMGVSVARLVGIEWELRRARAVVQPDLTIVLDVSVKEAMKRLRKRSESLTVIEMRGEQYFEKVRQIYLSFAKKPEVVVIDAEAGLDEVFSCVLKVFRSAWAEEKREGV